MKALRTAIILAMMAATMLLPTAIAQNAGTAPNLGAGKGGNAAVQGALRITSPTSGQVLNQNFVVVKYELTNPGVAAGAPNFRVQLDGRDPVVTTFSEYTFTGIGPGQHTITVDLVDANNTPVAGTHTEIKFNITQTKSGVPAGQAIAQTGGGLKPVALAGSADDLPNASSALPLLSVIGFGALLGGIASALRTR